MPRPEFSLTPPALQEGQANQMEVFSPPGAAPGDQHDKPPFEWGPVSLRPHLYYRFLDGSGIPTAGSNHVSTTIQEISPGLLFGIGNHWALDYTPTWSFYSNKQFRNTLDHNVTLTGGAAYEDWVFGLSQNYSSSSEPLVETGTQTDLEIYSTAINASRRLNSRMSLDLAINQNFTFATQFESFREWSTLDWLNYQFWPRLDVAIGVGLGYDDVETGSDMTYEQFQGRIRWRATDKISFQLHVGLEDRQFLSGGAGDLVSPVFGAAIQYQPFETTTFSLSADRAVTASLLPNQAAESTSINCNLNQRFLKRLNLGLGGAYNTTTYVDSSNASTDRTDDYYSFNVRLSCSFLKRGTAAVFYQKSDNSSTAPGYTFLSSQAGLEIGYRY
jgi:hypothetical protein